MGRGATIEELKEAVRRRTPKSAKLFRRATKVYPEGEISAARMFDPWPFYAVNGEGPYIWDLGGNRYIDTACSCSDTGRRT